MAALLKESYLDNTKDGSGMFRSAKECFDARFHDTFAPGHLDIIKMFFYLLDPAKKISAERLGYLLVHREYAKSSFGSFLIPMYVIYLKGESAFVTTDFLGWNEETIADNSNLIIGKNIVEIPINEDFIVIASETGAQAERFVAGIKTTIETRGDLAKVFGEKHPNVIDYDDSDRRKSTKKWRVQSFITADGTVVEGVGSGQRFRGALVEGKRPSLIILDDIYSAENTKTENSRKDVDEWLYASMANTLDTKKGKLLWLGTMIHPDTVIADFNRPDSEWHGISRPIISMPELDTTLKSITTNGRITIPNDKICKEMEKDLTSLSWPERHNLRKILFKYKQSYDKGTLKYFYQEFMNQAYDPQTINITPDCLQTVDMKLFIKDNRQCIEFVYENLKWTGTCNLYAGVDPASSEVHGSDDTAIVVAGYARCIPDIPGRDEDAWQDSLPTGKVFPIIAHMEGGKYSITKYNNMKGMADVLLMLDKRYKLEYINMEAMGQQEQMIREIRKIFREDTDEYKLFRNNIIGNPNSRMTTIWSEVSIGKKDERIRSIIYPVIHRFNSVLCNKGVDTMLLYNQLLLAGFIAHDDYADAYAISMKNVTAPPIRFMNTSKRNDDSETRLDAAIKLFGTDAYLYL